MKAVILAGGFGTRLSEETDLVPKPLVEIGGRPILWHVMKLYAAAGLNDFVICAGYKASLIKHYFASYFLETNDIEIRTGTREVRYLTNGQFLKNRVSIHEPRVTLPLDPAAFIEGVTVDPRAEDWYLEAVAAYANRAGLRCIPTRSRLYEPEPQLNIGINRRWVPVADKP